MNRKENWPELLSEHISVRKDLPFVWGGNDCCIFASDAILLMTGVDLAKGFRGYKTAKEAATLLSLCGGVEGLADAALGARIPVSFAQRGDVVAIEIEGRTSLAICDGVVAFAPGLEKLEAVAIREATCAWRV